MDNLNKSLNTQKTIDCTDIIKPLADLIEKSLINVEETTCTLIKDAIKKETNTNAKWALQQIADNNEIAKNTNSFACQDCGQAVIFASVGQDIRLINSLEDAIQKGVELGYKDARKSVADPLTRINTKTNTPAIIHYQIVNGDKLELTYLSKGAGSENMSKVYMLTPASGRKGIIDSVVETVKLAGANPCPPIIIGIGIGGTMEKCAILSKKALTRKTGTLSKNHDIAKLEQEILTAVNSTEIGAQGLGGVNTALAVAIETHPTHIGMLPIAINIQCHSVRHGKIVF